MSLLTVIESAKSAVKDYLNKKENEKLTEELELRKLDLRRQNVIKTIKTISNYLAFEMLENTGLLYRPDDDYIQAETQRLFWEWKKEGIINEFEDFTDETKNWIFIYS